MYKTSLNASRKLFHQFILTILRLSLSFFERTPFGRIITRCSTDFDMIDNDMIFTLRSTMNAILGFISCFLIIAKYLPQTIPLLIIIFIPFIFLEVKIEKKRKTLDSFCYYSRLIVENVDSSANFVCFVCSGTVLCDGTFNSSCCICC